VHCPIENGFWRTAFVAPASSAILPTAEHVETTLDTARLAARATSYALLMHYQLFTEPRPQGAVLLWTKELK
jgi:hypothetical protein